MPNQTVTALKTPGFTYRGVDVPSITLSGSLIDNLGTGEPAYKLAMESAPLSWRVALYTLGRDLTLGIDDFNASALPAPTKEAGRQVYVRCQKRKGEGAWHKDGAIIEPGATIRGSTRPGEGYVAARYFIGIDGFERKGDDWDIKANPGTREERIWLPPGGGCFIVPAL